MAFARATGAIWLVVGALAVGCGGPKTYELYFELDDPINAPDPRDPASRKPLTVEIVCLTPTDAKEYPMMLNNTWQSSNWFTKRGDATNEDLGKLRPRIYSLGSNSEHRLADQLISPSDNAGVRRVGPFLITHPEPDDADSAIVIYARYIGDGRLLPTSPVVIQPLKPPMSGPGGVRGDQITVKVGATSISRGS